MYLKIKSQDQTKQYMLTDQFAKPYLNVSGSKLPLTTNTASGLQLKVQIGTNTYRPLEYQSMSASATYYTSAVNSEGLSSTTALTRASTSDVSYATRISTSGTNYGTRASTSGTSYGTLSVSAKLTYTEQFVNHYVGTTSSYVVSATDAPIPAHPGIYSQNYAVITSISTRLLTRNIASSFTASTSRYQTKGFMPGKVSHTLITIYGTIQTSPYGTVSQKVLTNSASFFSFSGTNSIFIQDSSFRISTLQTFYTVKQSYITSDSNKTTYAAVYEANYTGSPLNDKYSYIMTLISHNAHTETTGTTYLTRSSTSGTTYLTRSSTSSTVYLTRSSTSGYSGVSSSSSESSGWQ